VITDLFVIRVATLPARIPHSFDVKPYVKRQKNDAADAEAICEAVTNGD
jgi:hypothetical protein